jgi:hypothetical protein
MISVRNRIALLATLALVLVAGPSWAAPVEKETKLDPYQLLPNDTEAVITFQFKSLFESALIKKLSKDTKDEGDKAKKEIGFDPTKDLHSVILAIAGGAKADEEKLTVIINGTFDAKLIREKVEKAEGNVKIIKEGDFKIYEVTKLDSLIPLPAGAPIPVNPFAGKTAYAAVEKSAIIFSLSKDNVVAALEKAADAKKAKLDSKELKALIAKIDPKQTISLAILATSIGKEATNKFESITGGITIDKEIKTAIVLNTKDAAGAKALNKEISDGIDGVKGLLAAVGAGQPGAAIATEILGGIKVGAKDGSVTIDSEITQSTLEELGKALGDLIKNMGMGQQ